MRKVAFLAIIIAIGMSCRSNKSKESPTIEKIKVTTVKVQSLKNAYDLGYSGTIEASQTIPLSFKTNGTVEKIYVEVGDAVKKGQLLARVDDSDVKNIYNTMLVKYQQAKDAYDRLKIVYDEGSLSEIKWVEMKSNYEQAKSSLALSKNNLENCNMYAPIDGIVGSRNIEPGQYSIGLTSSPFELVKIQEVYVKISIPENEINKIAKGQEVTFFVSALNDKQFEGIVSNISPVADVISRTYTVKILVKNKNLELKPGMVCDVTLNLKTETFSLIIPYKSVNKDFEGKSFVYVVSADNASVNKQIVTIGKYRDTGVEVISGLKDGQIIVFEGTEKLVDNSLISL